MHVDIGFHHLAELVFVRFLHYKVTFPPFLWKVVTMCSPHGEWRCLFPSSRVAIYLSYMEFFCMKDLALLPPIY